MTAGPIQYPDLESLSALTSGGPTSPIRVVLTVRPYGSRRWRNEFHVWLYGDAGVFLETAGDEVVEDKRVGESTLVNLDLRGAYCVVRKDPTMDVLPRLFNHLAGPAAFGYQGLAEAGWVRTDVGGRAIFYRRGPLRLRAVFDLHTRLPIAASTDFGTFRWEYWATRLLQPAAPDVRAWRIEETVANYDVVSSWDEEVEGIPAQLVRRLASDSFAHSHSRLSLTFRSSSMPRENLYHRLQAPGRSDSVVEIAIDDADIPIRIVPGFGFTSAIRAGDRLGRVYAIRAEDVRLTPRDSGEPIDMDLPPDDPEPTQAWRARIASTVASLTS
jgi:hypothetical protein